jgi:para-aminobenzoate synthetase component 1
MTRNAITRRTATVEASNGIKKKLLHWAGAHEVAVYFDSNDHPETGYGAWDCLVAAGVHDFIQVSAGAAFQGLKSFYEDKSDWLFGFMGYDLKNETERMVSAHPDGPGFPDMFFFQPEVVVGLRHGILQIQCIGKSPDEVWAEIRGAEPASSAQATTGVFTPRISKDAYLKTVNAIRKHIADGDVYEMNFCQEFYQTGVRLDPVAAFSRLNAIGKAPFSCFMRMYDRCLLSASPERFLRKAGNTLISQPIKGTRRRGKTPVEDLAIRRELSESEKDRSENVMIVDLVRNDLAKNCRAGTVRVSELFGIHTFATVHQMISTVTGELRPEVHPVDAIRDAFPMGSMTGAPKVAAMKLIEQYETVRRGLYSGAIGYFTPGGDFDFNVVIRSLFYNAKSGYLSFQVGGAIVYDSVPEQEFEECLVKAEAMIRAIGIDIV